MKKQNQFLKTIAIAFGIAFMCNTAKAQWVSPGNYIYPSTLTKQVVLGATTETSLAALTINTKQYHASGFMSMKLMGYQPNIQYFDSNNVMQGYLKLLSTSDFQISTAATNQTGRILIRTYTNTNIQLMTNNLTRMTIDGSGNVGIGATPNSSYRLQVCGSIRANEIRVETGWCDYVFAKDYKLPALSDVENYIKENKHLPDVTSGPEIENNGLEVGKVSSQMIKKIEELTLYVIELQKQVDALKNAK